MKNIGEKRYDDIIGHLIDIKERISRMEQHLKDLNGTVLRQQKELEKNKNDIASIKKIIYKCVGGLMTFFILFQIAIS